MNEDFFTENAGHFCKKHKTPVSLAYSMKTPTGRVRGYYCEKCNDTVHEIDTYIDEEYKKNQIEKYRKFMEEIDNL